MANFWQPNLDAQAGVAPAPPPDILPILDGAWPDVDLQVDNAVVLGNTLYIAGQFTLVGGQTRNRLAAIDIPSKTVLSWNPNPDNVVAGIAAVNGNIWVVGFFSNISGVAQASFAELHPVTAVPTALVITFDQPPFGIVHDSPGSAVYFSGGFTLVNGQPREVVAKFDTSPVALAAWSQSGDVVSPAQRVAVSANKVLVVDSVNFLRVFDKLVGTLEFSFSLVNFYPVSFGDTLFIQESFILRMKEDGTQRTILVNPSSGVPLIVHEGILWMSTMNAVVAGRVRNGLTLVDATTGEVLAETVLTDTSVQKVLFYNDTAIIVGSFKVVGTEQRLFIASFEFP